MTVSSCRRFVCVNDLFEPVDDGSESKVSCSWSIALL